MAKLTIPETEINIDKPVSDFLGHLGSNERILFSGKFGIGKTFFLKQFFEIKEIKEKYNAFHLFPINYQIASNEDIAELIKYDILYHLFSFDGIIIDNNEFSKSLAFQFYFMNNSVNIITKILQCVPIIKDVGKAIETLNSIYKEALKYKDKIDKNEVSLLKTFYEKLKQEKGSIHEFDAISEFIYNSFANCNNGVDEKNHKKNVLIIDDLDRIDPEHIFRLLNIFSAHIDREDGTNKFGFDKIIFVCDEKNIRNIFAAKYGQNTDFNGYIDKFYSSIIFNFNNKTAIFRFVKKIMDENRYLRQNEQCDYYITEIEGINDILYLFIEGNVINLRQTLTNVKNLKNKNQEIGIIDGYHYSSGYTIIWTCLKILGGQKDVLVNAFEKAILPSDEKFNNINLNGIASLILPLTIDNIPLEIDENKSFFFIGNGSFSIEFKLKNKERYFDMRYEWISAQLTSSTPISFNVLQLILIEAVNKLYRKGLLY